MHNKITLLLVEDDSNVAQIEKLALEKLGYYIILAQTGDSAVNMVNTLSGIDMILMDITLGKGIDGTEAAKIILAKHDIPLIFLTSHVDPDIVSKTEHITSYGYVIKGSGIMVLDASIKMALKLFESKKKEKEKEIALRDSDRKYKFISEITSDFVFSCLQSKAGEFKIDWMAGAVEKITGYTIPEIKKRSCWKFLVHPDDVHVFDKNIINLPKGDSGSCMLRILAKNNSVKWLSVHTSNLTSPDSSSLGHLIGGCREITESKLAEETLLKNKHQYDSIVSKIPVGIYIMRITPEGSLSYDYISPNISEIAGVSSADIIADKTTIIYQAIHPDDRDDFIKLNQKLIQQRLPADWKGRILVNGKVKWIHISSSPEPQGNGDTLWYGIVVDITESKQYEEARKKSEVLLKSSLECQKDTILFSIDKNYSYLYFNKAHADAMKFAYNKDIAMGMNVLDCITNDEDRIAAKENYDRALNGESHTNVRVFGDVELAWYESFFNPIVNENNDIIGATGLARNISDRKSAEEALKVSEKNYQLLFHNLNAGFALHKIILDENGKPCDYRFLEINPAFEKITGLKADDIIGKTTLEVMPNTESYWIHTYGQVALTGNPISFDNYSSELHKHYLVNAYSPSPGKFATIVLDITDRKQAEIIQKIQHNIADAMVIAENLENLCETIRLELSALFDTTNFYIALYDPGTDMLSAPFDKDEKDVIPLWSAANSMTGYVIKQKKSTLMNMDDVSRLAESGAIELIGARSESWLGVPLEHEGRILGVMVVQSYTDKNAYNQNCVDIMETIANQLTIYIGHNLAEIALREREKQIETFLNATSDMAFLKDDKFGHLIANRALCDFYGKTEKELFGKTDFDLMDKNFALQCRATDEQTLKQNSLQISVEVVGDRYYETRKFPVDIADGKKGVGGYIRDISESMRGEEALRKSEIRYRTFFNEAPFMVWEDDFSETKLYLEDLIEKGISDFEAYFEKYPEQLIRCLSTMKVLDANKAVLTFYGAADIEELKQNIAQTFTKETLMVFRKAMSSFSENLLFFEDEVTQRTFSGEIRNVFMRVFLPVTEADTFSRVIVVMIDITDRLKAQNSVRLSEQRFRSIWDKSFDGMRLLDKNGRIIMVNSALCSQIGKSKAELEGQFLDVMFDLADGKKNRDKAVERFENEKVEPYLERQINLWDGRKVWFELSNSTIDLEDGERFLLSIFRDITERKKSAEEIIRANEELVRINAQKDKFFSIIAHDLKSPFQGFLGLTEIMAEDANSFTIKELTEFSLKINKSARVLYELLVNLLEWAQMQRGNITFTPKELNVAEIASNTLDTLMSGAAQKEITIETRIPESLTIYADEKMIDSVIRSLLSNAIKFTPRGGGVLISALEIDSGKVEISVRDTGIGMSEEYRKKLFKIDEKVGSEGTEDEPSTGLGLLLCKEFVEKNGGTIRVESEKGKGSTFHFTIPSVNTN